MIAHLFCSLPALHGADGEAESCSAGDVWNVHVVVEPLVPPVNKHRDNDDHNPYSYWCTAQRGEKLESTATNFTGSYRGFEQGTLWVLTLSHNCSPPWYIPVLT